MGYAFSASDGRMSAALPIFAEGTTFANDETQTALKISTIAGTIALRRHLVAFLIIRASSKLSLATAEMRFTERLVFSCTELCSNASLAPRWCVTRTRRSSTPRKYESQDLCHGHTPPWQILIDEELAALH